MSKADVVAAQKVILLQAQDGALDQFGGACYDQGAAEATPAPGGGFSQADLDAAVAAAVGPLNDQIGNLQGKFDADELVVADLTGKLSALQAGFDELKVSDDALVAKESGEAALIKGFSDAKQSLVDILAALDKVGAPAPAPIPDPVPVDPAPVDGSGPAPDEPAQ